MSSVFQFWCNKLFFHKASWSVPTSNCSHPSHWYNRYIQRMYKWRKGKGQCYRTVLSQADNVTLKIFFYRMVQTASNSLPHLYHCTRTRFNSLLFGLWIQRLQVRALTSMQVPPSWCKMFGKRSSAKYKRTRCGIREPFSIFYRGRLIYLFLAVVDIVDPSSHPEIILSWFISFKHFVRLITGHHYIFPISVIDKNSRWHHTGTA